ncbi:putative AAA family ATPase [Starmerella bacillaris]|uniref:AAA family ATPase n=1 Tax=Starmerella bacillaris TaxID=1247836 RepID=A0AAV5RKK5_STABA|nr:putative AAA family ATPase [Starmerella bacillaris]
MQLFSRKPSLESCLNRIYTEAYQSSLQSILQESSFEFQTALKQWRTTLDGITTGMAQLDGRPPRTGQEKSLLSSIMDIEKQCHERIASLQRQIDGVKASPYGEELPDINALKLRLDLDFDFDVQSIQDSATAASASVPNVPTPPPTINKVKPPVPPKYNLSDTSVLAEPIRTVSPVNKDSKPAGLGLGYGHGHGFDSSRAPPIPKVKIPEPKSTPDITRTQPTSMPSIEDMQYDMYHRSPKSPSKSEPMLNMLRRKEDKGNKSKKPERSDKDKKEEREHRSSLDYPQVPGNTKNHALLSTLRTRKPLGQRQSPHATSASYQAHVHAQQQAQAQQQARRSAEINDANTAMSAAQSSSKRHQKKPSIDAFKGFDGVHADDEYVPTSPGGSSTHYNASISAPNVSTSSSHSSSHSNSHSNPSSASSAGVSHVAAKSPTSNPTKYTPKVVPRLNRPRIRVEYEKVQTASGRSINRPVVVRNGVRPHTNPSAQPQRNSPSPSPRLTPKTSPKLMSPALSEISDPSDASEGEEDEWELKKKDVMRKLKGVDQQAAEQILNDIVIHGDPVNWDDIAGLDQAKSSLKEAVVYPFLRPDLFMGLREPVLGMLLFGPPGTGKTMLARAVATESKSTFFSITASSLTSKYMGESEKLVRALFQLAKALAPSIIFIDEIDSLLTQRADSGEHEASRRIKNEFLVQWSDLQAAAAGKNTDADVRRVLVLGATNLPWAIDEAARRRFVRRQYIPLPETATRRVHLSKLLSHQKHALTDEDIELLVTKTEGYSGSDITALAKDAAMGPLRALGDALLTTSPDQVRPIDVNDFIASMRTIKPSVSQNNLKTFEEWAKEYGSSGA